MQKLSFFIAPLSSSENSSLTSVLSKENICCIARAKKALVRQRKFDVADYTLTALNLMCSPTKSSELTLKSIADAYNKASDNESMTVKCIHKQLQQETTLETVKELCQQLLTLFKSKSLNLKLKENLPADLKALLKRLKVNDIILIDGTEIDLQYSCADNFSCKSKGRPREDGSLPRPGIKLHVAFSIIKNTFEYIEVTEAVGSERDCVHPERFKNCLIIADRGYISEDLEKRITDSGNLFLIRGKANTAGVITECFDDNGQNITKYIGKTVKAVPEQTGADLTVVSKLTDHKLRVVLRHNQNAKADEQRSVLRTNIPRECLCAKQIFMLYRVRWSIELFNKANKRSNCLQSINSADKNIILTFVLLSLIASLSKTYCGIKAMLKKNIQWISMLKLHKLNTAFSKLFRSLQSLKLSSIYQIFKELFDEISTHCQRTTPSNRDRVLLKDLPLLVWQIVNQPNPFDQNVLRS